MQKSLIINPVEEMLFCIVLLEFCPMFLRKTEIPLTYKNHNYFIKLSHIFLLSMRSGALQKIATSQKNLVLIFQEKNAEYD